MQGGEDWDDKMKELLEINLYPELDFLPLTAQVFSREDWDDSMILLPGALPLTVLTDVQAATAVTEMVRGITGAAITELIAYKILNLAWNLRSQTDPGRRVFPQHAPVPTGVGTGTGTGTVNVSSLSIGPWEPWELGRGTGTTVHEITIPTAQSELSEFVRGGCFCAASLLRLFTKEHESWIKAQDHIARSYRKFTGKRYPLADVKGWGALSVDALKRLFRAMEKYKCTLGLILYSLNQMEEGRDMTMMLFERHLSFTGMHIVPLFQEACAGLRVHPNLLMGALKGALRAYRIEPVFHQLKLVIQDYMGSKETGKDKETYKYARIFDSTMFSHLRTKNCSHVVCILGHLGKLCGNVGSGNFMDIAGIAKEKVLKEIYEEMAHNIFTDFRDFVDNQTSSGGKVAMNHGDWKRKRAATNHGDWKRKKVA